MAKPYQAMRAILPVFLLLLPLSAAAQAATPTPLFDGFKTFCADTGAHQPAIEAAMRKAGGKLTKPLAAMTSPFQLSTETWEIDTSGRRLNVFVGSETDPASKSFPERDFESCTVMLTGDNEASLAAVRKWIRVAPYSVTGRNKSVTIEHYTWRDTGAGPMAVPKSSAAYVDAEAKGQIWSAEMVITNTVASVQFRHLLKAKALTPDHPTKKPAP